MDFSNLLNFERDSIGTYYDSDGVLQVAQANEPRFDHDPITKAPLGLLIEEERTNLFLNSSTPVDQSITFTADYYSVSITGVGSVSVGGFGSATESTPLIFLATAGSAGLVITGDVFTCQVEKGPFPTSYIPTSGAPVTRKADICSAKSTAPWLDATEGAIYAELNKKEGSYTGNYATLNDGTDSNFVAIKDRSIFYKDTNYMPSPFDPEGWYGNIYEGTDTIQNIKISNSSGESFVGLATQVGEDQFVLCDTQTPNNTFPVLAGDKVKACMIVKSAGAVPPFLRFRFANSIGFRANSYYDVLNNEFNTLATDGNVTQLQNGDFLVECSFTCPEDDPSFYCQIFMWADFVNTATPSGAAPIGSQLYVQSAFFGKSNDWTSVVSDFDIKSGGIHKLTGTQGFITEATSNAKIALTYDATTYAAAKDGEVLIGTSSGVPSVDSFFVGSDGANRVFNGHIKDVKYYPRKLTNDELIDLTA